MDEYIKSVMKKVLIEKGRFREKYSISPKYVKVPEGFKSLGDLHNIRYCIPIKEVTHFCGLLMCETPSVQTIADIEVF